MQCYATALLANTTSANIVKYRSYATNVTCRSNFFCYLSIVFDYNDISMQVS